MSNPLVSIIVPVYNAAGFLAQTIECILKQSYKPIELILVNDGSTDNSEEVIKSFSDERIRYYYQQNRGQCAAANAGWKYASGDYIKFFDADDLMNDDHIRSQVEKLAGRKDSVASCAWGRFYDGNPGSTVFNAEPVWQDMNAREWLRTAMGLRPDMMAGWLWLIPKELLQKAGGWNEQLSLNNDFEFSVRLLLHAQKVLFTPGAKVYYRSGLEGSLSRTLSEKTIQAAYLSTYLGCSHLLAADNSPQMKRLCANRYQEWIFRFYPAYPSLLRDFEQQVQQLGGSDLQLEGGLLLRSLSRVLGWRKAKKIKKLLRS